MTDRELTELQETGLTSIKNGSTLSEVIEGIETLGLDSSDVHITAYESGIPEIFVTGYKFE